MYEMAKSLKSDDAKLKGLKSMTMLASYRIPIPSSVVGHFRGGYMKKLYFRTKYRWHSLKFKQLKSVLMKSLDDHTKLVVKQKIDYHEKAALKYILKA
jgi:hypothetical protein